METKETKENKKLIILIGILFAIIIGLLIVLIYITNNSKKTPESNSSTTTTTTTTQIAEKNPYDLSKLNNEEIRFIDIEALNRYEYTADDILFEKSNTNNENYNSFVNNHKTDYEFSLPFIKISNKKLYWNINNEWKEENKITEEINYADFFLDEDVIITKFIIITTNKIYIIEIPNGININDNLYEEFNKEYSNLKYQVINEKVTYAKNKEQLIDCNINKNIYLSINDKIYILNSNTSAPVLASDYYKNFSSILSSYINSCGFMQSTIAIDKDGIIQNDNIDKTFIKNVYCYFGNEKFEMVIDRNMNYYLKSNNNDYYGKIKSMGFNRINQELRIEISPGKNIILKDTSNGLWNV